MDEAVVSKAYLKLGKEFSACKVKNWRQPEIEELEKQLKLATEALVEKTGWKKLGAAFRDFFSSKSDVTIDVRFDFIKKHVERLRAEGAMEAVLTPMTQLEVHECRYEWAKVYSHLKLKDAQGEYSEEGKASIQRALDLTSNSVMVATQVLCITKKAYKNGKGELIPVKEDGRYVRFFNSETANAKVSPAVLNQIWAQYYEEFVLTEDELGKSPAPTKAA